MTQKSPRVVEGFSEKNISSQMLFYIFKGMQRRWLKCQWLRIRERNGIILYHEPRRHVEFGTCIEDDGMSERVGSKGGI